MQIMDEITSPRVEQRIRELQQEISPYVNVKVDNISTNTPWFLSEYVMIPVVVLLILVLFRPYFIMAEKVDEYDQVHYTVDVKKVIMYWLIFSVVCMMGLFGYRYKKV